MQHWHWLIKDDKSKIVVMIEYFENELKEARREVKEVGVVETIANKLPAYHETRFSQLQELETVLEVMEIELKKIEAEKFKTLLEHYKRALSSSDCRKYMEMDEDVIDMKLLIADVSSIRNQVLGIVKSLEMKHYQLGNIVKLKTAGLEDSRID